MDPEGRTRVLIVDDEEVIAESLAIILKNSGFDAQAVYSGTAAVQRAKTIRPDIVITDVSMPDISGIEAAARIRQELPHCRVLIYSGHASSAELLANPVVAANGFQVVAKPIHPHDLLRALHGGPQRDTPRAEREQTG